MQRTILTMVMLLGTLHAGEPAVEPQTATDCQPRRNPNKFIPHTDDHELLCLKKGLKNIFWGESKLHFEKGLTEKEWNNNTFSTLKFNALYFINNGVRSFPYGAIIYRKNKERSALLLEKYLLENDMAQYSKFIDIVTSTKTKEQKEAELKKLSQEMNSYIIGTLLEYSEENMEYFYKDIAYGDEYPTDMPVINDDADVRADAQKIVAWAATNQNKWKPTLDKEKNAYKVWMDLNKDTPNSTLRKQNEALSKAISMLNYNVIW